MCNLLLLYTAPTVRFSSESYTVNENEPALLTLIVTNINGAIIRAVNISSMDGTATGNLCACVCACVRVACACACACVRVCVHMHTHVCMCV